MIEQINLKRAIQIIRTREPKGQFIVQEKHKYVGIDNRDGDAWCEEFDTEQKCKEWLGCRDE